MSKNPNRTLGLGLKTRHVFLDTQVYRQYGHNLNAKVLQTFLKQIKAHVCTLHITDITKLEIERQLSIDPENDIITDVEVLTRDLHLEEPEENYK